MSIKIALVQQSYSDDFGINVQSSLEAVSAAVTEGADIICYPEIHLSPFFPQYPGLDVSEYVMDIDHDYFTELKKLCREHKIVAFPNVYLQECAELYDASPVIGNNGDILGISKMVHIAQIKQFYEQDYYCPSNEGFIVYDTGLARIGVVICFDRHIPESIRSCALQGAELVIIPTANTAAEDMDLYLWEMRVAAFHNGLFIAMCNRTGQEGEMDFCGGSMVIDPFGEVVFLADEKEGVYTVEFELDKVQAARKAKPFIELMRPELY